MNQDRTLVIGGVSAKDLAKNWGTPLYVMDEEHIRKMAKKFKTFFKDDQIKTEVIYASKAFFNQAMAQVVKEEGLSLDVVSGGELFTAYSAQYPMENVYFHGNYKSDDELRMAVDFKVGTIVLDHPEEGERLISLLKKRKVKQKVMVRVNPAVATKTHEYIQTAQVNSKFGVSLFSKETLQWLISLQEEDQVELVGLHAHIGSQIFQEDSFFKLADLLIGYAAKVEKKGVLIKALNLGGGFGVAYRESDEALNLDHFLPRWMDYIKKTFFKFKMDPIKIMIEPGRSIVANAGTTLYTVGATKRTRGNKNYIFVDGSLADHMRTALYGAEYEACLLTHNPERSLAEYTVVGRTCESGDVIIESAEFPCPLEGDIMAIRSTGAYHYSMASQYNRLRKPAVVFVKDGVSKLVVKRETYEDLIRNDKEI